MSLEVLIDYISTTSTQLPFPSVLPKPDHKNLLWKQSIYQEHSRNQINTADRNANKDSGSFQLE